MVPDSAASREKEKEKEKEREREREREREIIGGNCWSWCSVRVETKESRSV